VLSGRVLVVHEAGATRALLRDLLAGAGFEIDLVDSTYQGMARFVDAAADLVILGLATIEDRELGFIRALKAETTPPRVLVMFPSPQRDVAVRALQHGADSYLLEPFYADEIVALAKSLMQASRPSPPQASVAHLAEEVAHAVNNPLQVMRLLLEKDRVTKRELMKGIPDNLERIEAVVRHLREFGVKQSPVIEPHDLWPIVKEVAKQEGVGSEAADVGPARVDATLFRAALATILHTWRERCPEGTEVIARLDREGERATISLRVPRTALGDHDPEQLLEAVFTVQPDRTVLPGLAGPRALLEAMKGTLTIDQRGDGLVVTVGVPLAR